MLEILGGKVIALAANPEKEDSWTPDLIPPRGIILIIKGGPKKRPTYIVFICSLIPLLTEKVEKILGSIYTS